MLVVGISINSLTMVSDDNVSPDKRKLEFPTVPDRSPLLDCCVPPALDVDANLLCRPEPSKASELTAVLLLLEAHVVDLSSPIRFKNPFFPVIPSLFVTQSTAGLDTGKQADTSPITIST